MLDSEKFSLSEFKRLLYLIALSLRGGYLKVAKEIAKNM